MDRGDDASSRWGSSPRRRSSTRRSPRSPTKDHPNYQKYEHAKDAAYNAVVLRVATGEHDKAIAERQSLPRAVRHDAPRPTRSSSRWARRTRTRAATRRRRISTSATSRASKNQDHRVQGYVLLAQRADQERRRRRAPTSRSTTRRRHRQAPQGELGPDGKYAAAHARYMEGERVLAKFEQIQISGDVKQLCRRAQAEGRAPQAGVDGLPRRRLARRRRVDDRGALPDRPHVRDVREVAPRRAGAAEALPTRTRRTYQTQIDEFVVPIEERSLDAYENGWKKAIELGIYNQWTAKMREALGRLNARALSAVQGDGLRRPLAGPMPLPRSSMRRAAAVRRLAERRREAERRRKRRARDEPDAVASRSPPRGSSAETRARRRRSTTRRAKPQPSRRRRRGRSA